LAQGRAKPSSRVVAFGAALILAPISRTIDWWRRETGSVSGTSFSSTSQCASPSSPTRRSKPRM
jgi:hypothetical protein